VRFVHIGGACVHLLVMATCHTEASAAASTASSTPCAASLTPPTLPGRQRNNSSAVGGGQECSVQGGHRHRSGHPGPPAACAQLVRPEPRSSETAAAQHLFVLAAQQCHAASCNHGSASGVCTTSAPPAAIALWAFLAYSLDTRCIATCLVLVPKLASCVGAHSCCGRRQATQRHVAFRCRSVAPHSQKALETQAHH
jgi:hypothetical protein